MGLPFSVSEFLQVFAAYNRAVWPAQLALYALGLTVVIGTLLWLWPSKSRVLVAFGLCPLWAWMGAIYHLGFYRLISRGAFVLPRSNPSDFTRMNQFGDYINSMTTHVCSNEPEIEYGRTYKEPTKPSVCD